MQFNPPLFAKKEGTLSKALGIDIKFVEMNLDMPWNFGFGGKMQLEISGLLDRTQRHDMFGSFIDGQFNIETPTFQVILTAFSTTVIN